MSIPRWPEQSKYFDPDCHDSRRLGEYLAETEYVTSKSPHISSIRINGRDVSRTAGNPLGYPDMITERDDEVTVLLIEQSRLHYTRRTTANHLRLDPMSWSQLLALHDVHPSFLDILHSNNGGFASHVSPGDLHESSDESDAMHVMLKIGNWQDVEHAVYARQHLVTGKVLVLVLGTGEPDLTDHLYQNLRQGGHYDMFRIIMALLTFWVDETEQWRWHADYETQGLETRTGFSNFETVTQPLPLEKLSLSKDLSVHAQVISNVRYGSLLMKQSLEFLAQCMDEFDQLLHGRPDHAVISRRHKSMKAAIRLQVSLMHWQYGQLEELASRINWQIETTKALIVQRDVETNIVLARDMAQDSKVMKVNAVVTTLFLPMTAFATFFSMVFFRVIDESGGRFVVNEYIWLHIVTFVPTTAVMVAVFVWWLSRSTNGRSSKTIWSTEG